MSFIHRSIKYLYRKKGRSLLLLMLMMAISLGILGSVSIQKATDISRQEMKKSLNTHFTLLPNPGVFWGVGPRGFGDIPASMIEDIAKTEGIHDYQMTLIGEARLPGMKKKDVENPRVQYNAEQERLLKEHFDFEGNRNTELDHKFISGVLTLKEGRHLQAKDQGKALVHEDFAKSNGLSLHDTLTYRSSPVNEFTEKGEDTLEIVGIFSGSNQAQASHREELFENMILTDLKTAQSLRAYNEDNALYDQAHFFVEDPDNLESILNKVKNLAFPWERYQVSQAEQNYAGMLTSLSSMD